MNSGVNFKVSNKGSGKFINTSKREVEPVNVNMDQKEIDSKLLEEFQKVKGGRKKSSRFQMYFHNVNVDNNKNLNQPLPLPGPINKVFKNKFYLKIIFCRVKLIQICIRNSQKNYRTILSISKNYQRLTAKFRIRCLI